MKYLIPVLAAAGIAAALMGADVPKDSKATKAGWWIKVCDEKDHTQCDKIKFEIGPSKDNVTETITWVKGSSSNEFDVSAANQQHSSLYVRATVEPRGKNGYIGVCFKDKVCNKHYDFDESEDHDVKQGDRDEWKCN